MAATRVSSRRRAFPSDMQSASRGQTSARETNARGDQILTKLPYRRQPQRKTGQPCRQHSVPILCAVRPRHKHGTQPEHRGARGYPSPQPDVNCPGDWKSSGSARAYPTFAIERVAARARSHRQPEPNTTESVVLTGGLYTSVLLVLSPKQNSQIQRHASYIPFEAANARVDT